MRVNPKLVSTSNSSFLVLMAACRQIWRCEEEARKGRWRSITVVK